MENDSNNTVAKTPKKAGRPKKQGNYFGQELITKYLELCKVGNTLSQIANYFGITDKELKKWASDPKKLSANWELGKTFCKGYHETLYREMISNKDYKSHQVEAQKHIMAIMFEDWNLKKESKVEISNKYDDLSNEQLDKLMFTELKKRSLTDLVVQNLPNQNKTKTLDDNEGIAETIN